MLTFNKTQGTIYRVVPSVITTTEKGPFAKSIVENLGDIIQTTISFKSINIAHESEESVPYFSGFFTGHLTKIIHVKIVFHSVHE